MKKYNNGNFTTKDIDQIVEVYGWVMKKRDLGGLVFIDLRDRSGIVQLVVRPENEYYELASSLKTEAVIKAIGKISKRESVNTKIPTGEIEILVEELELLNTSSDLPFEISMDKSSLEETRLKYRYLDIRRDNIKDNLMLRNDVTLITRNFLSSLGFIEIETPILCVPTPEGARDYLVPSRITKGNFYALPQSPQIYKQLLMIGGMEKYFQIARSFRDEDLRKDRQPEFTQIDIEMSFSSEEDIWAIVEGLMKEIFLKTKNIPLPKFDRLTHKECFERYGSDKPDIRYALEIQEVSDIFEDTEFQIYKDILSNKGIVNAIVLNNQNVTRKEIDEFSEYVKIYKAKILSYIKVTEEGLSGSLVKNISEKERQALVDRLNLKEGDVAFILADSKKIVKTALGALRSKLATKYELFNKREYKFLWVTDFPMFEFSEEDNRFVAAHHPFTSPKLEDMDKLETDKENCYSRAYDLVVNGYELLSGSVRIHDNEIQAKVFSAIGLTEEEAKQKFGFFLEAFKYGAPPHCGVGIGLERLIMLLAETENIKDVVAFPKTASASCLMTNAPGIVNEEQLRELGIKLINKDN